MKVDTKQFIDFIKDQVLPAATSWELEVLVGRLSEDNDEACSLFCEYYELGNWFYEALILHNIDISSLLIEVGAERELEEKTESKRAEEIAYDLRLMQEAST